MNDNKLSDYEKGMNDTYDMVLGLIKKEDDKSNIIASIITFIKNFKINNKQKN